MVKTKQETKKKPKPVLDSTKEKKIIGIQPKGGSVKKPHRFRPGTVALREIRKYVQGFEDVIPNAPFERAVRDIADKLPYCESLKTQEKKSKIRFTPGSIFAIKSAAQDYMIRLFQRSYRATLNSRRKTLFARDMRLFTEEKKLISTDYPETMIKPRKRNNVIKKDEEKKITKSRKRTNIIKKDEEPTQDTNSVQILI